MGLTIGVDIGGTKIAAGVVDEEGNILSTHKVPTPGTPEGIVDAIASAVEGARAGHEIVGVGIGAAGYVNRQRSEVYFAPNIDWRNEPLKEKVEARVGLPVVVENDANAAAWGEYKFGAGKGHRNVICITLGTGLGGGIIIGNKLRRGHYGVAAEFGHIRMVPDGLLCGCGSQGCWEQYASGRALVRYAKQRANATPESAEVLLGMGDGSPEGIEGKHISMAARQGDPVAVDSYRELARWAGAGLADLASSSTRPPSSSAAASRTRASWSSTPSASPTSAGSWAATGARWRTSSPPSSATRRAWWARRTWPGSPTRSCKGPVGPTLQGRGELRDQPRTTGCRHEPRAPSHWA